MFDQIAHAWRRSQLRKKKRWIGRAYDADIERAYSAKKPSDEIESVRASRHWELSNCDDEIAEAETEHLLELAEAYGVPTPSSLILGNMPGPGWYQSQMYGRLLLSTEGRAELRSAIRAEKRERREAWLPYISALTGLLGVVVAIIALLLHSR